MYRVPSSRKPKKKDEKINLVPILDAVFILIFFLLMSAQFIKIFEISSNVPIVSDSEPPKDKKKPLALTLVVDTDSIVVQTGVPSQKIKTFSKNAEDKYPLEELHQFLVDLKKKNINENEVIIEPSNNVLYEDMVLIMDAVRMFRKDDESIFRKTPEGLEEKVEELFAKIVFGNIMS